MTSKTAATNMFNAIVLAQVVLENQDFQAPMFLIMLDVYRRGVVSMTDLETNVGLSQAAVSRIVAKLGRGQVREKGLELVEAYEDPEYRRRKLVKLTTAGTNVMSNILRAAEGKKDDN